MTAWHYKVDYAERPIGLHPSQVQEQIIRSLNRNGEEGWELVDVLSHEITQTKYVDWYIYKRPMAIKK
jgi:hypothetical protein